MRLGPPFCQVPWISGYPAPAGHFHAIIVDAKGGQRTFAAGARLTEVCSGSGHSMGGEIVRPFCSVSVRPVRWVGKHSN